MRVVVFALIVLGSIITAYVMTKSSKEDVKLKVIQPKDITAKEMVPEDLRIKGNGHFIGDFSFQDQNNKTISLSNVKGKVFVVDYFFTTCGTICPKMTKQMMRVQDKFSGNKALKILSFTVNPEIDTVEVMKKYSERHNAIDNQWHFLTGSKSKLYDLARRSFFVLKPAEAQNLGDANSDFIHTNNFVLIDKKQRIRGYYDGTSITEVNKLMEDIEILIEEK